MTEWTIEDVAARFEEAAYTGRRLPPVRVCGAISIHGRSSCARRETFAADEYVYRPLPPTPDAVDLTLEAMKWVQWLAWPSSATLCGCVPSATAGDYHDPLRSGDLTKRRGAAGRRHWRLWPGSSTVKGFV